jgi:tetratricopeptide (TPR) repeat protein
VAITLQNLGRLYKSQGRYREAQSVYVQALIIRERRLGSVHPLTVKIREIFINFLRQAIAQGHADLEALPDNTTIQTILAEVQASLEQSE